MNSIRFGAMCAVGVIAVASAGAAVDRERKFVVLAGDPEAPGSRLIFVSFSYPVINDNGEIAFRGSLDSVLSQGVNLDNNNGIWRTNNGVLERIAREGSTPQARWGVTSGNSSPRTSTTPVRLRSTRSSRSTGASG